MILLSFSTWSRKKTSNKFTWDRYYFKGYKWTPFVIARRYDTEINIEKIKRV